MTAEKRARKKRFAIFAISLGTCALPHHYRFAGVEVCKMRSLIAVVALLAVSEPCLAKTLLKSEPYFLAPFSIAYVDNGVCGVGKVLRVKGALGAMRRQRTCVPMGLEQASLVSATP